MEAKQMISNYSVLSPFGIDLPPLVPVNVHPWPRKVSQKERRKKARYRRSQGIKRRTK